MTDTGPPPDSHDATASPAPPPVAPLADADAPPLTGWTRPLVVLGLALLGGALFGIHTQKTAAAGLGYVSTAPWVLLACHPRLRGRGNFWALFLGQWLMTAIGLYWLRGQNTPTWLIAPLLYFPILQPVYFLVKWTKERWPAFPLAVLWGLSYTGMEWLRVRLSPGELALCILGHSQVVRTKLIQVADIGGVGALTLLCAASAGLTAEIVLALTTRRDWGARVRLVAPSVALVVVLFSGYLAYGFQRDTESHFHPGPTFQVMQTNLPRPLDFETSLKIYDFEVVQTLSTARPGKVDAILWPENAIMTKLYLRGRGFDAYVGQDLFDLSAKLQSPILVDGPSADPDTKREYHSALLVKPDGSYELYDKIMLLPWTEYVPLRDWLAAHLPGVGRGWLAFVKAFVGFIPNGTKGRIEDVKPFHLKARDGTVTTFGTPVCFEIATPRVVNAFVRQGVDFLVNQTSEGRLGNSLHEQTLAVCGFRAVEGRVPVVRATNDGISAWIDSNGRVRDVLHGRDTGATTREAGVFYPQIQLDDRKGTFYSRHGDWLPVTCLLLALALALTGRFAPRRQAATTVAEASSAGSQAAANVSATTGPPESS